MNGVALLDLVVAIAAQMPSAAANKHAGREWQLTREAWLRAIDALNLSEDVVRDLSSRRRALADSAEVMQ
jgi:hypothetical protein